MMRRMLKRKIHPELEGKGNKLDGQCKPSVIDVLASKKHEAGESVSLLQSPGIFSNLFRVACALILICQTQIHRTQLMNLQNLNSVTGPIFTTVTR